MNWDELVRNLRNASAEAQHLSDEYGDEAERTGSHDAMSMHQRALAIHVLTEKALGSAIVGRALEVTDA